LFEVYPGKVNFADVLFLLAHLQGENESSRNFDQTKPSMWLPVEIRTNCPQHLFIRLFFL
jgi:hypothetical protein